MLDEDTRKQFEASLASGTLRELCDQMGAKGLSQVVIYEMFSEFLQFLGETDREADYDNVYDALNCMVGWCSPGSCWFDHYLSNEEIYAYESGLTEQEVQEISDLVLKEFPTEVFFGFRREANGEVTVKTGPLQAGSFDGSRTLTAQRRATGWQLVDRRIDDPNGSPGVS